MIKKGLITAGLCVLLFVVLEGFSSTLYVSYRLAAPDTSVRTLSGPSVRYDSELGWVSVPGFYEKNYYAPGIALRINSRGFRANEEFTREVPQGKTRIVCSGDSFTFGDGVDNSRTWCQVLESLNGRLQTVNLAETGYGIDQMYLWYQRNAGSLEHQVQILAFIADDFRRIELSNLGGYGKPVLKIRGGDLAEANVPVPKASAVERWLAQKPSPLLQFRSLAMANGLVDRLRSAGKPVAQDPSEDERMVFDKIVERLKDINHKKNSSLVLVFLPTWRDYDPAGPSAPWRRFLREEAARRGVVLIDLIEEFQKLPVTTKDAMFIWPGSSQYYAESPGHYSDPGNEYIARQLYSRLEAIPDVARQLKPRCEGRSEQR
jgi:hypothetical protein